MSKYTTNNIPVARLIEIDRLLSGEGFTAHEFAERFKLSIQTARRQLAILKRLYGERLQVAVGEQRRERLRIDPADRMFAEWVAESVDAMR